ncbi:MAG: serine/threonine protein phosphatase [Parvularculaceae bacterium]|nr:serine/threonine protein phosphatase [Parvularculaceae bacterium]
MLGRIFGGKQPQAAVPEGQRLYAIGDIHGCAGLLDALLALIGLESRGAKRRLVFLGDYVDRGQDSRGVIDRLLKVRADEPETIFLKGNHEQAMLDFLQSPDLSEEWLHWGGDKTLESYGVADIWRKRPSALARELDERLPEPHREFLRSLDLWRVVGDYAFVHAGFRPGVALEDQRPEDCLWIRGEFHNAESDQRPRETVVHGHHPVKKPTDAGWRINVDTGAVWSDALTAVVLEGTTRRFLSTRR